MRPVPMVVLMFLSGSCIHLNGKPWCNAKASVFKVIFYLTYLFILTRNVFCCSHSWQLKQQNTKPVQDDLICTCEHDAPSSQNQLLRQQQ